MEKKKQSWKKKESNFIKKNKKKTKRESWKKNMQKNRKHYELLL